MNSVGIGTSCTRSIMERTVMPMIRRAGMKGLTLSRDAMRIQAMVDEALKKDPEYVRRLCTSTRRWA